MSELHDHCFVLWADRFDEVVAVIYVAELRRAGLRVKLVGLPGPGFVGVHGLALAPDLTLDEALALAQRVACIVAPSDSPALRRLANDPRLMELLDLALAHRAPIVVGPAAAAALGLAGDRATLYGQGQGVRRQARQLARQLAGVRQRSQGAVRPAVGWPSG